MTTALCKMRIVLIVLTLASCSGQTDAPALALTSVDGTRIEINDHTPLTVVIFFSVSNPVALGAFERLSEQLDYSVNAVAVAMHVDRPPSILQMQQRTLIPIVTDESNHIAEAFGGVDLTPTLILIDKGRILLRQRGRLDVEELNAYTRRQSTRNDARQLESASSQQQALADQPT